jgi:hypothetical protein
MMHHRVFAVLFSLSFLEFGSPAGAQSDNDWPCIQPRVAALGVGQMWSGPALESAGDWRADPELAQLVRVLAARRLPVEQAGATIDALAASAGPDKNQRLTLLFAGLFDDMNASRTRMVVGIERYARRQRELAQRINDTRAELASRGLGVGMPGQAAPSELEQSLAWDTRIYDERVQTITYLCETPVQIEQRLFALARIIQNDMD